MRRSCKDPTYVRLVFEYLLHMGLIDTISTFVQECDLKGLVVPQNFDGAENPISTKLIRKIDSGNEDNFFEILYSSMPDDYLISTEIKKLVADLHVHFLFKSYKNTKDIVKESNIDANNSAFSSESSAEFPDNLSSHPSTMRLSNFLERHCSNQREHPEFKPYFSLVFAPNSFATQLFQHTSQDFWIPSLKARLKKYLQLCNTDPKIPDIVLSLPPDRHLWKSWNSSTSGIIEAQVNRDFSHPKFSHEDSHEVVCQSFNTPRKNIKDEEPCGVITEHNILANLTEDDSQFDNYDSTFFIKRHENKKSESPNQIASTSVNNDESFSEECREECHLNYTKLQSKFSNLHTDYHNLIGVASELAEALENCARGQPTDLRETLSNCVQIFPELFCPKQQQNHNEIKSQHRRSSVQTIRTDQKLHIPRIKKHLQEGNMKSRLLLLQALRWAVTRRTGKQREWVMKQYVNYDLFNLQHDSILKNLLEPPKVVTPHPLQQSAARLLNTIASVQSGRSYLSQNSETVRVASLVLQQQNGISTDSITKNMLLAALQKLSLRRNQRTAMIQAGMVEWLFMQLPVMNVQSPYSLEYGTALLMNLLLHQSARDLCVPIAVNVVTTLINLLSTSTVQALPYINGLLYSVTTHTQLNRVAADVGLSKSLQDNILKQTNEGIQRQMEHILQSHQSVLHHSNSFPLSSDTGEMIDEDGVSRVSPEFSQSEMEYNMCLSLDMSYKDIDLLGQELDEQDPIRNVNGELCGEELLSMQYMLPSSNNGREECFSSDASESSLSGVILQHVTPCHGISNSLTVNLIEQKSQEPVRSNWCVKEESAKQKKIPNSINCQSAKSSEEIKIDREESQPDTRDVNNVPLISVQLVSTGDTDNSDKSQEIENDSDDVQVAPTPIQLDEDATDCECPESSSKPENHDAAAFASRPKIPRTPPHH